MKRMYVTAVAAVAMMFSVQTTTAQGTVENQPAIEQQTQKDDFQEIQASELPEAVRQAVELEYSGATIDQAYQAEKDGETKYKLEITTADGQSQELFSDAEGNLKDKDNK